MASMPYGMSSPIPMGARSDTSLLQVRYAIIPALRSFGHFAKVGWLLAECSMMPTGSEKR